MHSKAFDFPKIHLPADNDDYVIKYSKDLIESDVYRWKSKSNKKKSKIMNYIEKEFDVSQ